MKKLISILCFFLFSSLVSYAGLLVSIGQINTVPNKPGCYHVHLVALWENPDGSVNQLYNGWAYWGNCGRTILEEAEREFGQALESLDESILKQISSRIKNAVSSNEIWFYFQVTSDFEGNKIVKFKSPHDQVVQVSTLYISNLEYNVFEKSLKYDQNEIIIPKDFSKNEGCLFILTIFNENGEYYSRVLSH